MLGTLGGKGHLAGEADLLVVAVYVLDDDSHHPSQSILHTGISPGLLRQHLNKGLGDQLKEGLVILEVH